jgi:hypothetical protein
VSKRVKYAIRRQKDGSFAILMKDSIKHQLTTHSLHDTYDDANDELTDIHHKPSQVETMEFLNNLTDSIKRI